MERLTQFIGGHYWYNNEDMNVGDKLGQLEDVLEKYGIESVEQLSNALEFAKVIEEILSEYGINDNEELDERLGNAIVPQFKIGQKVWFICGKSIRSFTILKIDIEIRDCALIGYSNRCLYQYEENCFATEEEARKRLEELKGE